MHYVIGDVHGCYSALMKLLDKICLTPEDKVFFVGDFTDRAPTHEELLKTNQWVCDHITEDGQFQAVIGNHDLDTPEMPPLSMLLPSDTVESLREVGRVIRQLPLYKEVQAGGYRNIITHSWICDKYENTAITKGGKINEDYSIKASVWDRNYSVTDRPTGCRVIHGHTITSGSCYEMEQRGAWNRIIRQGETNVNVDCGCFTGLSNGGNLAAFRLEDGMEFYAYDRNDAIAEYKELAELSTEAYKLKDYQIFIACNPLREAVLFQDDSDYTKYARESFISDYGPDYFNKEDLADWVRSWSLCVRRNHHIDRRFVLWRE